MEPLIYDKFVRALRNSGIVVGKPEELDTETKKEVLKNGWYDKECILKQLFPPQLVTEEEIRNLPPIDDDKPHKVPDEQ